MSFDFFVSAAPDTFSHDQIQDFILLSKLAAFTGDSEALQKHPSRVVLERDIQSQLDEHPEFVTMIKAVSVQPLGALVEFQSETDAMLFKLARD